MLIQTPLLIDDPMAWWEILLAIGSGGSAIVVAYYAVEQALRERTRQREQTRRGETRVSTLAYLLRRQLLAWLGPTLDSRAGFEAWIRTSQDSGTLAQHLDRAEATVMQLYEAAGEASGPVADGVRRVFVLFFAGAERLNEYSGKARPHQPREIPHWAQAQKDAEVELRSCLGELGKLIGAPLLQEERVVRRQRQERDPDVRIRRMGNKFIAAHEYVNQRWLSRRRNRAEPIAVEEEPVP
jgi:hypothetical protein